MIISQHFWSWSTIIWKRGFITTFKTAPGVINSYSETDQAVYPEERVIFSGAHLQENFLSQAIVSS